MHSDHLILNKEYSNFKDYSKEETAHLRRQTTKIQETFSSFTDHHNKFTAAHNKLGDMVTGINKDIEKLYKLVQSKNPTSSDGILKGRHR